MNVVARSFLAIAGAALALSACGPRHAEVRTAPSQAAQVSVTVANNLPQAVNVYVVQNDQETFLKQVAGNANTPIPVPGFAPGSTVTLKAVTVDGVHTYSRQNVVLSGTYTFTLP
jgi:hypothetical protein